MEKDYSLWWQLLDSTSQPKQPFVTFISYIRVVEQADFVEMFGRGDGLGDDLADRLVEGAIGAVAEGHGEVLVLHEVLDVAQLVVYGQKVVHVDLRALLDAGTGWKMHCDW